MDAPTKLIPVLKLEPRTQATAHAVVHALVKVLAPQQLPTLTSDSLKLYFYALTAHFGDWVTLLGYRARHWQLRTGLLYGHLIKRYRRRRLVHVERHAFLGSGPQLAAALRAAGPSGLIQTALIERLNSLAPRWRTLIRGQVARAGVTARQAIAALSRRTRGLAQSPAELGLRLEWWRAYYHCARPHTSLPVHATERAGQLKRQRFQTPAQAAGLTNHRWTVKELLSFPLPKTAI